MIRLFTLCVLLAITACDFNRSDAEPMPPTTTTMRVVQTTLVPTVDRGLHSITTPTPTPGEEVECQATAGTPSTRHSVTAKVNYSARSVEVQQEIHYINRTNEALDQVVLNVEPNRLPGAFELDEVAPTDAISEYELTGRRLTVTLLDSLEPGCALDLELDFTLHVPPVGQGINAFSGYFGYTIRQFNLGHWLATVALRSGGEWITHDVSYIGEQGVAEVADWDVTISVSDAPPRMMVAAPGDMTTHGETEWHFTHSGAREFSLSMSPFYNRYAQVAENGVMVELYAFGQNEVRSPNGVVSGSQQALTAAALSLSMFADLFGDYPYSRFVIVQGDFPDGMEFSDLVFVSDQWFQNNPGTQESYLTFITVHEVSHQWWYARVGSDQALTPWLDEALATYSEYIFYEEHFPDLKDWWWSFRVDNFVGGGTFSGKRVDSSVYEFATIREYINAVYLRGAHMLHDLRDDLGTDAFFDWLARYAEAGSGRVVTPDVFWSLLTPEQLELTRQTRAEYMTLPPQ